jgi:hypothetical protein
MKVQDLESRTQLDNCRNTQTLNHDVTEDYNDPKWVSDSRLLNYFGSKLKCSLPLILIGKQLSEVSTNVYSPKWGRSGNGDGNWVVSAAERAFAAESPSTSEEEGQFQSDTKVNYCTSLQLDDDDDEEKE